MWLKSSLIVLLLALITWIRKTDKMKVPLDCKLLRLGMKYVTARANGNFEEVSQCLANSDLKSQLKPLTEEPKCQQMMKNVNFIHAYIENLSKPRLILKFPPNYSEHLNIIERFFSYPSMSFDCPNVTNFGLLQQ